MRHPETPFGEEHRARVRALYNIQRPALQLAVIHSCQVLNMKHPLPRRPLARKRAG